MKTYGNTLYHLGVLVIFTMFFLISCEKQDTSTNEVITSSAHHAADWTPTDPNLLAGKETYKAECAMCHDEGEEGAPLLGDKSTWEQRVKQPEEEIVQRAIKGYVGESGEMPPKGGSDYLSDEQVRNAVKFMIKTPTH